MTGPAAKAAVQYPFPRLTGKKKATDPQRLQERFDMVKIALFDTMQRSEKERCILR